MAFRLLIARLPERLAVEATVRAQVEQDRARGGEPFGQLLVGFPRAQCLTPTSDR